MADTENTSKTGKWVDSATGQVVDSPPARGIQLVAPGGELTPDVKKAIAAAEEAAKNAGPTEAATKPATTETTSKRR